ncbi:hypothetical protein Tco_1194226 [Tanacetum coccineum]
MAPLPGRGVAIFARLYKDLLRTSPDEGEVLKTLLRLAPAMARWCGGPFNGGNCRHCTNVSFGDEPVYDSNPNSYNQTPDFSNPPSQTQTSSLDQWHCFHCKDPLEKGERCKRCSCKWCGSGLSEGFCFICASSNGNSSNNDLNPKSFNDPPNDFTQYKTYLCELCGNDSHFGYDCPLRFPACLIEQETVYQSKLWRECEDMIDKLKGKFNGMSIKINKKKELQRLEQVANLSTYPSQRFKSFCYDDEDDYDYEGRNEELSTISEKELDEFIKSSVEDLVPIPSESEDAFESDSDCNLSSCDDFSPINAYEKKSSTLLVTPLSDFNEDECFTPSDDVELLLYHDLSISVVSILEGFTDEPPLEGNDDLFYEWKKILYEAPNEDLKSMVKDCPDFEGSRARCFVHRSLDLQSFTCFSMEAISRDLMITFIIISLT